MKSPDGSHEALLRKPTVRQAFDLSAAAMCLAKEQDKLQESRNPDKKAKLFVSNGIEEMRVDEPGYTLHRFSGIVSRYGDGRTRRWSMRLVERFWAVEYYRSSEMPDPSSRIKQADTSQTIYELEWNSEMVTRARRNTRVSAEGEDGEDPDDDWRNRPIDSILTAPDILNAANQYCVVSQADTDRLLKSVRNFSVACRSGNLAVSQ